MSDFEKSINASDLIEWIMCAFPDWCVGDVRRIVDHVNEMPSAQPEIIYCKDCKYCDRGIDEDGNPFLKCLGWVYGGTQEEDFCSHAERRTDER